MRILSWFCCSFTLLASCSVHRQMDRQAKESLYQSAPLQMAHTGISIYDMDARQSLYQYQGDKFFIPASTTKLFTLYTGLSILPDSLVAARVALDNGTVIVQATGDPTFLHPDFSYQPLLRFLQNENIEVIRINTSFDAASWGAGWSWDDFKEPFMAERDPFPMYGNVATISYNDDGITTIPSSLRQFVVGEPAPGGKWSVTRDIGGHIFSIDSLHGTIATEKRITMAMNRGLFASRYLSDTLHKTVLTEYDPLPAWKGIRIYSQPRDSVFKIMMHRSDNFFAEQTLLMAANEQLGKMNDAQMIDTMLMTTFAELPQKPRWVDGSGLSRYNLFSPNDFVWLLRKMQDSFGIERMKRILPTANEGTLKGLFSGYENRIFAKSGSLSNNYALAGYLFTRKGRRLAFSIMINNYRAENGIVKKEVEQFLTGILDRY